MYKKQELFRKECAQFLNILVVDRLIEDKTKILEQNYCVLVLTEVQH